MSTDKGLLMKLILKVAHVTMRKAWPSQNALELLNTQPLTT